MVLAADLHRDGAVEAGVPGLHHGERGRGAGVERAAGVGLLRGPDDGHANSTTEVVFEAVTVNGKVLSRPKRIINVPSAVSVGTCEATPSTRGCRVLKFVYAPVATATSTTWVT